jgi:hypothetical protein
MNISDARERIAGELARIERQNQGKELRPWMRDACPAASEHWGLTQQRWVLKKSVLGMSFAGVMIAATEFMFSPQLKGGFHSGCYRLAEEPHQSLDVLGHRC